MEWKKVKKTVLLNLPYVLFAWMGNKVSFSIRTMTGEEADEKLLSAMENFADTLLKPLPSFHMTDILVGILVGVAFWFIMWQKKKNAKKLRTGREYGNAHWASEDDANVLKHKTDYSQNLLLSQTVHLTMGKPAAIKYARNKNVIVVGGSGSGKTRFYLKPNLMQMHSSYVVTDPKGTVLIECGKMLQRGRPKRDEKGKQIKDAKGRPVYEPYKIKVFNTVDFGKSMHYNPMAYIRPDHREADILKLVDVLIKNTAGSQKNGEDFWVKAEKLLYTSYIALLFAIYPPEERNFESLIDLINDSEVRENDETYKNNVDLMFEALGRWIDGQMLSEQEEEALQADDTESNRYFLGIMKEFESAQPSSAQCSIARFALRQFKSYKLAAGKTAKSILISCATRLGVFSIDEILEITSRDEMELDKIGDELTALFVIVPDTDETFNFLVAIMYTQMFNLLCTKADNNPGGKLKYHVRCLLDEFKNIGEIPNFDKLIATIRSREISASIILQTKSQLKDLYKDNADTIEGNCDSTLFLGGKEKTTLKDISEILGKETIDAYNTSENRGQSPSYGLSYQKMGRELMTEAELHAMDGDKCITLIRGFYPFFTSKYDITRHPMYGSLLDANPKAAFDIAAHVRGIAKANKATVSAETVVEVYEARTENTD